MSGQPSLLQSFQSTPIPAKLDPFALYAALPQCDLAERSIAIVVEELLGDRIVGNQNVGSLVSVESLIATPSAFPGCAAIPDFCV